MAIKRIWEVTEGLITRRKLIFKFEESGLKKNDVLVGLLNATPIFSRLSARRDYLLTPRPFAWKIPIFYW